MRRCARRKLLLKQEEIDKLAGKTEQKGLTLIPLRIYFKAGYAKCELALARGKEAVGSPAVRAR